jgi:hypothetical protein
MFEALGSSANTKKKKKEKKSLLRFKDRFPSSFKILTGFFSDKILSNIWISLVDNLMLLNLDVAIVSGGKVIKGTDFIYCTPMKRLYN